MGCSRPAAKLPPCQRPSGSRSGATRSQRSLAPRAGLQLRGRPKLTSVASRFVGRTWRRVSGHMGDTCYCPSASAGSTVRDLACSTPRRITPRCTCQRSSSIRSRPTSSCAIASPTKTSPLRPLHRPIPPDAAWLDPVGVLVVSDARRHRARRCRVTLAGTRMSSASCGRSSLYSRWKLWNATCCARIEDLGGFAVSALRVSWKRSCRPFCWVRRR